MLLIAAHDVKDLDIIEVNFCDRSPVNHTQKVSNVVCGDIQSMVNLCFIIPTVSSGSK